MGLTPVAPGWSSVQLWTQTRDTPGRHNSVSARVISQRP